jgi:nucleoside 2-deoxyribosyltransferase
MKIYFAASIRGGRADVDLYRELIEFMRNFGDVLTEHVGESTLAVMGEDGVSDEHIHSRDMNWLLSSDRVVAEVTTPSLGVGYEIGRAIELEKPVLCLYRSKQGKRLSAMIAGSPHLTVRAYSTLDEAKVAIVAFLGGK